MPTIDDRERFLTIKQVADMLHVHYGTVLVWRKKGLLPFIRVGRRALVERFDVERLIKSSRFTGPTKRTHKAK